MPKKEVVISHVYEVRVEITTTAYTDSEEISQLVTKTLRSHLPVVLSKISKTNISKALVKELCYDEDGPGGPCVIGEGHRGLHEDGNGHRWGNDL